MPKGRNAWNKLLAGHKGNDGGSLSDLQAELWYSVQATRAGLDEAIRLDDTDEIRKWIHCQSQIASTYLKVFVENIIIPRIEDIEKERGSRNGHRIMTQRDYERLYVEHRRACSSEALQDHAVPKGAASAES